MAASALRIPQILQRPDGDAASNCLKKPGRFMPKPSRKSLDGGFR
jgi:hypothetical protein